MQDLRERIIAMQQQSKSLEPDQAERDQLLNKLQQYSNTFLNRLPQEKAYSPGTPNASAFKVGGKPRPLNEVLDIYAREVAAHGVKPASGGHMGYIPGGGIYASALGEIILRILLMNMREFPLLPPAQWRWNMSCSIG